MAFQPKLWLLNFDLCKRTCHCVIPFTSYNKTRENISDSKLIYNRSTRNRLKRQRRCFGTVATVFFSKRVKTVIAVWITAESSRPHLRAYDIAHHAQFVQTVTGSRRALLRAWKYFTVIHVSKCYVFLYERQWEVCLYQFGSFHRRRRHRKK